MRFHSLVTRIPENSLFRVRSFSSSIPLIFSSNLPSGTNTYIIGTSNPYTLIDTAEGRPEYIPILKVALTTTAQPLNPSLPDVSDIIISHWHHDHVDGLPSVLALLKQLFEERNPGQKYNPPRLHKFPYDHSTSGQHSAWSIPEIVAKLSLDTYLPSAKGDPFHELHDNQILLHAGLRILHTPGHTTDSICIHVPQDKALYSADTVLGEGTAVFEDLGEYLDSLQKMLDFDNASASGETAYTTVYPGHGPVVKDGKSLIKTYIQHRLDRESQIMKVLGNAPPTATGEATPSKDLSSEDNKNWTTWSLVSVIYAAYPESLWPAAANSVELHLRKLERDGVVRKVGGEIPRTEWEVLGDKAIEQMPVDRRSPL